MDGARNIARKANAILSFSYVDAGSDSLDGSTHRRQKITKGA